MTDIIKNEDVKVLDEGSMDLLIEHYSNSARTLQIRGLTREATISADMTTSSDRSLVSTVIDIDSIPLFLTAKTSGTGVKRGELFVKIYLRVNGAIVALLMSGYVCDTSKFSYPGSNVENSTDGHGLIRSVTGTNPAAGAEISETVPTGARWRLIAVRFALANDATVANRNPRYIVDDGTNILIVPASTIQQTASAAYSYNVSSFGANVTPAYSSDFNIMLPEVIMNEGWRFRTNTIGIQAGDDYGAPQLLVEEWITP